MLCTPEPNGFADHYPYEKWLFHSLGILTQHFQLPTQILTWIWWLAAAHPAECTRGPGLQTPYVVQNCGFL